MVSYRIPGPIGMNPYSENNSYGTGTSRMFKPGPLNQIADEEFKNIDDSLTVFLGGAGMVGDYNQDFVNALLRAGLSNVVFGNYSGLLKGVDKKVPELVDMLGDASVLVCLQSKWK